MPSKSRRNCKGARSEDVKRALASSDARNMLNPVEKALYLIQSYGVSIRRAAELTGCNRCSIERAQAAVKASRQIGRNGRRPLLSDEEAANILSVVESRAQEKRCMDCCEIAAEVPEPY
jgi:hypothetical protein